MQCKYFGQCGGCNLGGKTYKEQLAYKIDNQKENFKELYGGDFEVIKSDDGNFRNRAEFRIWKKYDKDNNFKISYAMNSKDKQILPIDSCAIVSKKIAILMPILLDEIKKSEVLHHKLFACEFLSSTIEDTLVTLIYHKKLDEQWEKEALKLEDKLQIKLIGRSKKQRVVLSDDFIKERLNIDNNQFYFFYKEGGFIQPNQKVNEKMINWVIDNIQSGGDLCELYCGGGNFTIPLAKYFDKILATEVSKTSIKSAKLNCKLNNITNIKFVRMSSEEFADALNGVREFRRLKQENINLDDYRFKKNNLTNSTIFVDPPRAGLDDITRKLCSKFNQIIYISCNPKTLKRDLKELTKTHKIKKFAFFDQFAYSTHIESGVILNEL